jgi:hypothetical protein
LSWCSYLEAEPDQLLPFLKSVNQCDVATSERLLLAAERHAELVQLYFSRQMHRKALELLSKFAFLVVLCRCAVWFYLCRGAAADWRTDEAR